MRKIFIILMAAFMTMIFSMQVYAGESRPLEGRVVILDPGHGIGADNVFSGYSEQRRMMFLARRIQENLEARGATVLLTRETYDHVSLSGRVALMNKWSLEILREARIAELANSPRYDELRAEIREIDRLLGVIDRLWYDAETYAPIYTNFPFCAYYTVIHPDWRRIFEFQADPLIRNNFLMISLHSNATPGPVHNTNIHGADVFISTNTNPRNVAYFANYSHTDITYLFADMILDAIHSVGIARREIIPHHWFVIRETNLPAVLVENGFHTNARDRANLQNDDFMRRLAVAYADTIERYFVAIAPYATTVSQSPLVIQGDTPVVHTPIIWDTATVRANTTRNLTTDTKLFTNVGDVEHVSSIAPQSVWILEVRDNWAQIPTWLGPKWIMVN